MKRVVLYAYDFEPITVIELSDWAWDFLRTHGTVRLDILDAPIVTPYLRHVPVEAKVQIVTIVAEKLVRNSHETLMLFTSDEESALKLKAAFLPGQHSAVNVIRSNAFASGFMVAVNKLGK